MEKIKLCVVWFTVLAGCMALGYAGNSGWSSTEKPAEQASCRTGTCGRSMKDSNMNAQMRAESMQRPSMPSREEGMQDDNIAGSMETATGVRVGYGMDGNQPMNQGGMSGEQMENE